MQSLTGVWNGLFMYPEMHAPGAFTASLLDFSGGLSGTTHEPDPAGDSEQGVLYAAITGVRDGRAVSFAKTYDGTGGWIHTVLYLGDLNADGTEIEGSWTIPGEWSGRFLMVRAERPLTFERRSVFARA